MLSLSGGDSYASGMITFGPAETTIDGSVSYSVIGQYKARFKEFNGSVTLDDHWQSIRSVYLEIKVGSISSNCPYCDHAVISRRLLNAAEYPEIIFRSDRIMRNKGGYRVKGLLEMHGVKKVKDFPFFAQIINTPNFKRKILDVKGSWTFNRKEFNIVWNKLLDQGGILVGDHITVNWEVKKSL